MPATQPTPAAWVRVPHICPNLADVGSRGESNGLADGRRAEGPVTCLLPPVPFFPDAHSAAPASISAESSSNSPDRASNAPVSHLTSSQSSSPNAAEIESTTTVSVTITAVSQLTRFQIRGPFPTVVELVNTSELQQNQSPHRTGGGGWGAPDSTFVRDARRSGARSPALGPVLFSGASNLSPMSGWAALQARALPHPNWLCRIFHNWLWPPVVRSRQTTNQLFEEREP